MPHNQKINDFMITVEAISDGELTVAEMHDALATSNGYIDDGQLNRLQYVAEKLTALLALADRTREGY